MNPKVSIVMGVHNLSCNSIKAIESIINQSYKNWEFIICNDGSTDNTSEQLKLFSKLDKRIIILENKVNKGLAYSLNKCIKKSKGKYIARMDDDDFSKENRIEEEVKFLDNNPQYAFVSSEYLINNGKEIIMKKRKMKEKPDKYDFLWNSPFLHPATMFRKSALLKVDCYRVAKETIRAEDYDLYMRLYAKNLIGYNLQDNLYVYFLDSNSMTKRKYKYRVYESIVRAKGYLLMDIPIFKSIPFILKPLLVGLIPKKLLLKIQEEKNE